MMTIGSKLGKVTVLLALTTLVIGLGASLSWERPSNDGKHINKSFRLEVSGNSGLSGVNFYFDKGNGWKDAGSASENSGTYYTDLGSTNLGSVEGLKLKANTSDVDASDNETSTRTVTLDVGGLSVNPNEDNKYVGADPKIEFQVSDNYSDVINATASVSSSDGSVSISSDASVNPNCNPGNTCAVSFDIDTSDLSNGDQFTVDVTATDQVGKTGSDSATFTLDDSYNGDTSPTISLENGGSNGVVSLDEGEEAQVNIDIDDKDNENTDIRAKCFANDDKIGTTDYASPGDGSEFSCSVPADEYSGDVNFEVLLCDEAGNCMDDRASKDITIDTELPTIGYVEHPEGVSTFNGEFTLNYGASDDTGIKRLEYSTESGNYGSGIKVERDGDGQFTVAVDDISLNAGGTNTLYIRALDKAGQWSGEKKFQFEYYPNKQPKISLSAPERVEVKSDSTKTFDVTIENTGEFLIRNSVISDGKLVEENINVTDLKENSSITKSITIDASQRGVGVYNMTLSSDSPSASTTVEVVVQATKSQQQSIKQDVENWASKLESLESNISKLGGLKEENKEALEGNVSEFRRKVEKAQNATQSGEYYRAKNYLQNIDSEFSQASQTYTEVRKEYNQRMTNRLIMIALVGVVVLGGGAAGFLLYREEELLGDEGLPDVLPDDWEIDVPDNLPELGVMSKAKGLLGNGESEEEEEEVGYTFEDFT
ncbi:MAG: hypothetical protein ABEK16_02530 [Candidatus Nanohalobium sp.]